MSFPSIKLVRLIGVTMSCSSVPRSRSFTIAVLVISVIVIVSRMPTMPGTMNVALFCAGLYHGRTRISTGGRILYCVASSCAPRACAANCAPAIAAPELCGSAASMSICATPVRPPRMLR